MGVAGTNSSQFVWSHNNMFSSIASRALVRALRPRSYPHFPSPASSRSYSAPAKTWSPRITTASTPKPTVTPVANASTTASNNGDGGLEPDAVPVVAPKSNGTASTPSTPFGAEEQREGDGAQDGVTDWSKSYSGLSSQAFSKEIADILLAPIDPHDVEVKPGQPTRQQCLLSVVKMTYVPHGRISRWNALSP
jgi:hypothetical protein